MNILESLKLRLDSDEIDIRGAAEILYNAGWTTSLDVDKAKKILL